MKVIKGGNKNISITKGVILQGKNSEEYYLVARQGNAYSLVSLTDNRAYTSEYSEASILESINKGVYKYIGHSDDLLVLDLSGGLK